MSNVSVILLAGGTGQRMQSSTPKQFLTLKGKAIALHSYEIFQTLPECSEIIVVCEPQYRHLFQDNHSNIKLKFAQPGPRRQDSVYNGFQQCRLDGQLICIHDSARPIINQEIVQNVIHAAKEVGAAVAAVPVKFTVKESDGGHLVAKTHDRSKLWEIQTPQIIKSELLKNGFDKALKENISVTDDVSLVELLNHQVKLVPSSYANIKITTPEDLALADKLIN